MEKLILAGRAVGEGEPPYVVAELGANHNGDMSLMRRLVDAAKASGVDAVKVQSWSRSSLIGSAELARNTRYAPPDAGKMSLEECVERYQLTPGQHEELAAYCRTAGVTFFSSCFSREEVDLLESLGAPAYKVASMDVNHLPLLEHIARKRKPVLLSTGMATLGEVETALGILRRFGAPVCLLHCVSQYPCPSRLMNLRNMATLRQAFDVPVGLSDHSLGCSVPLAAVALGACVLEKHFTLDTKMEGWDHAISADPAQMRALVDGSREVFEALGTAVRSVDDKELEKRKAFRRRLVLRHPVRKGDPLGPNDVEFKRPGTGIAPDELRYALGRRLVRDAGFDDEIEWADLA